MKTVTHQITSVEGGFIELTTGEERDSIELSRNAKGEYSYVVKACGENLDDVRAKVTEQASVLNARYPVAVKA